MGCKGSRVRIPPRRPITMRAPSYQVRSPFSIFGFSGTVSGTVWQLQPYRQRCCHAATVTRTSSRRPLPIALQINAGQLGHLLVIHATLFPEPRDGDPGALLLRVLGQLDQGLTGRFQPFGGLIGVLLGTGIGFGGLRPCCVASEPRIAFRQRRRHVPIQKRLKRLGNCLLAINL